MCAFIWQIRAALKFCFFAGVVQGSRRRASGRWMASSEICRNRKGKVNVTAYTSYTSGRSYRNVYISKRTPRERAGVRAGQLSLALLFNRAFRRALTSRVVWLGGLSQRMLHPPQSTHKNIEPEKKNSRLRYSGARGVMLIYLFVSILPLHLFTLESSGNAYSVRGCYITPWIIVCQRMWAL